MPYIRVLHASPDASAVDVYANGIPIARNLTYKNFTEYLQLLAGDYNVAVYPAGTTETPLIQTSVEISPQTSYTLAVAGRLIDPGILPVPEPRMTIPPGRVMLRFVHLSPNAPSVDVTSNDFIIFREVGFKEISEYTLVDPGTYTFQLLLSGTNEVLLTVPNATLSADRFYTTYLVGLGGATPPLELLIPLDGNSYLP